ncbi:hypothetical protein PN471_10830 [Aphanizomenon sp. CS-733/32]|uniref:hypothetical protein n=1 Tax=Aphanizomenon sp. CS-733/32 TaxID=3021715 RepID=UPI00232FB837|nr:hypothetical protein [Aphanizomenon sp. CS-733/32]MDB9309123.1 hypothetical protein [Aphanizomenon sp. CS-733/32]
MEEPTIEGIIGKVVVGATTGFVQGLANDAVQDAYQQEVADHPDEDVPTHIAHAIGRFFGQIVSGS